MTMRRGLGIAIVGAGLVVLSCSSDGSVSTANVVLPESRAAAARIADLRARFDLPRDVPLGRVPRAARVALPERANGEVRLEDETSRVSIKFALEHVQDARIEQVGGMALYAHALDGADVVHRVHAEGTEDYVVFETRPAREELTYLVDVSRVPGLRLVSNTLEFLDDTGTPVLRVAPPYVVDARRQHHAAKLAVNGCAYDTSPAGPWGRKVTSPGAERCTMRVVWSGDVAYPAMVDPAWTATGSMATARTYHTASVLPSGRVLVAGGTSMGSGGGTALASAELFNPAGNAGAGTFAATGSLATARYQHAASVLASGKVLVTGGWVPPSTYFASAELYDPAGNAGAGTFVATGSMVAARVDHTASTLASGKVLIAGGYNSGGSSLTSAEIFNPAGNAGAGSFTATGPMPVIRRRHTANVLLSGKVLVAGGINDTPPYYLASATVFDPAGNAGAGTFAATGSMTVARDKHGSTLLPSGKVLVTGGQDPVLASAELFDPSGNGGVGTFTATGSMTVARAYHSASTLPSGKAIVVGGLPSSIVFHASAELFDPAGNGGAGTFAPTDALIDGRADHTASVLPTGELLIAGGFNSSGGLAKAELFSFLAVGIKCLTAGDCLSGFCADGVCCNAACTGSCDRCDLQGKLGACTPAPAGDPGASPACAASLTCNGVDVTCTSCASDATCAAGDYCSPTGGCQKRKAQGAACNAAANCKEAGCRECAAGVCVDGVCCDRACAGQCEACDSFAGTCGPISGKPHGNRPACPAGNECSATTNQCAVPLAVTTCDGDHTTTAADGTKKDCSPFKCDNNGACNVSCASVADCVAPTTCDVTKQCVLPPADPESDGCSVVRATPRDAGARMAWLAAIAGLALLRRRRAR